MVHAHGLALASVVAAIAAYSPLRLRPDGPFFSVIVLTWQRTEFLESAIQSVLAQSVARADYEIVVVRGFAHPGLDAYLAGIGARIVPSPSSSQGAALAAAVVAANGEVLVFLDDDDEMEPGRLAHVRALYEADPELALVRNANRSIDVAGRPLADWPSCTWPANAAATVQEQRDVAAKAAGPSLPMHNLSSLSARRSLLLPYVGAWTTIPSGADATVYLSALASPGAVRSDPAVLTRRRIHASTSLENYSSRGMGPPSTLERLRRLRRSHARQREMVRGTPAERSARWIEAVHRFEAALTSTEFPDPTVAEWIDMVRGIVRERQPFRLPTLAFAAVRRVAPRWAIRAWWLYSADHERWGHPSADYGALFSGPSASPSRPSPRAPH